ncbi:hypothetical protein G0U57_019635, partial [Chelydra serpentina]
STDCLAKSEEKKQETNPASDTSESDSPQPVYNPNCQWLEESDLNVETLTLATGAPAASSHPAWGAGQLAESYSCCTQCGRFLAGSPFGRVVLSTELWGTQRSQASMSELRWSVPARGLGFSLDPASDEPLCFFTRNWTLV